MEESESVDLFQSSIVRVFRLDPVEGCESGSCEFCSSQIIGPKFWQLKLFWDDETKLLLGDVSQIYPEIIIAHMKKTSL